MSDKVSLSECAQHACGQEGRGNVCRRLFHGRAKDIHDSGKKERDMNEWMSANKLHTVSTVAYHMGAMDSRAVYYLLILWHRRGMSLVRNMRDSQCGDSLLVMPHT